MDYREFAPTANLAPFVDRLWTLTGMASELGGAVQPVLPDGRSELVIHFADRFERLGTGRAADRQADLLYAGQLTSQLLLQPTGAIAVLGVRFHPFGASACIRARQQELVGLTPALEDLDRALASRLRRVTSMTGTPAAAVPVVQRILEAAVRPERIDPRVRAAAAMIDASGGMVSIDGLATRLDVSRRQLERRFLDAVGVPPKRLARITRFQAAVAALSRPAPRRSGAATAAEFGYADQSHFIREFRELAGCSPGEHLLREATLTGFFISAASSC